MLSREEFKTACRPLTQTWGENYLENSKFALLYSKLKELNTRQVDSIVESCLLEFSYAPSLQKIINLARGELSLAFENIKKTKLEELEKSPCVKCLNTGWLDAIDEQDEAKHVYAFKCDCLAGHYKVSGDNVPVWNRADRARFTARYLRSGGGFYMHTGDVDSLVDGAIKEVEKI